jgi:hypothetical protein
MTTLRLPPVAEMPEEDRQVLERMARRMNNEFDRTSDIWRAQMHWPQYLEANHRETMYSFQFRGKLPELTKQCMHVAVSMVNRCEF